MSCFLTRNIKHTCEYNAGGISNILLLDISHFDSYRFKNDGLYNSCYVEAIRVSNSIDYIELDVISESDFTETNINGVFSQTLHTYIRGLKSEKTSNILLASSNKYIVIFISNSGRAYTFGSDGGATFEFTQQTGKLEESDGYSITIKKESIYPLFEFDLSARKLYTYRLHDIYFDKIFN